MYSDNVRHLKNEDTWWYQNTHHFSLNLKPIQIASSTTAIVRICFPPPCTHLPVRPGSQPGRLRRAGTPPGAGSSSHGWVSSWFVPLWKVGAPSAQISAPRSRTAAFSCDASRTRFHRASHSSGKNKNKNKNCTSPSKTRGNALAGSF